MGSAATDFKIHIARVKGSHGRPGPLRHRLSFQLRTADNKLVLPYTMLFHIEVRPLCCLR